MQKNAKRISENGRRAYDKLMEQLKDTMGTYRAGMSRVKAAAGAYKNEQQYIEQHGAALASTARKEIEEAEREFSDTLMNEIVSELRTEVVAHLTAKPDKELMQTLSFYREFGITMTKDEAKALAYDCSGNYLALRALAAVADKSGVKVSFPNVAEYIKTADRLERLAQLPLMVCPSDYLHEGVELYPDKPLRRGDGSVYGSAGRPDSVTLLGANAAFDSAVKELERVGEALDTATVPEIGEYQPVQNDDGTEISAAQQQSEDKARAAQQVQTGNTTAEQLGQIVTAGQKEADRRAAAGREYYFGK